MLTSLGWEWQFVPFTPVLLLAALVMGAIAVHAWRNRDAAGAEAFAFLMAATTLWAVAYALQLAGANEPTKLFWANVVHLGVAVVPVAWLVFTLQFTGRDHWVTRRTVTGLAIVPAAYVVLVWTNQYHFLVREPLGLEPVADASWLIYRQTFGPAFEAFSAYGYALMMAGVLVLVHLLYWSPRVYRRQVGLLVFGAILPMAVNTIHHAGFTPIQNFDLTPFAFTVTGVAFFVAIYSYQLLDLTPIAREFVVGNLREGVLVVDREGRVVDLNAAAARLLGCAPDEAIGRPFESLLSVPFDLLEHTAVDESLDESLEDELVLETDSGRQFLHFSVSPVYDVRNEPLGRSIVVRDVTETRELEADVADTLERLQRSNRALEEFTAAVSHDLRGPVRTAGNYLSLFEREYGDAVDPEGAELVTIAREHTDRLEAMVRDLLEYSTIDSTEATFDRVDLDRVLADVREALRFDVEDSEASISVGPLPTVQGSEPQLRRLFQNLLSNAIAYSGDGPPVVGVTATRCDDVWAITVRDEGVGIEPGELAYVFELFTRADRTGAHDGTGMGLAMCKKIVEEHGGSIGIESTPGAETTVTVELPVEPQSETDSVIDRQSRTNAGESNGRGAPRPARNQPSATQSHSRAEQSQIRTDRPWRSR